MPNSSSTLPPVSAAAPPTGAVKVRPVTRDSVRRSRDPWFDNLRLVAAVLVVVGHCLTQINDRSVVADMLWSGSWSFRIPVYVFVAGWFSSGLSMDRARSISLLRNVLGVYVLFSLLGSMRTYLVDDVWKFDVFKPGFGMWFLLSLFCWRLLLPALAQVKHLLAWTVVVAVGAGLLDSLGSTYSASRTVAMLPLFVLGAQLRTSNVRSFVTRPGARLVAVVVGVGLFLGGVLLHDVATASFQMKASYTGGLANQAELGLLRLLLLAAGAAGVLVLLALVPRRRIPFLTYVGSGSMYVYLLHLLILQQLVSMGFFDAISSPVEQVAMVLGAVVVALALGSQPVRRLTRPLVQPRYTWPFVPEPKPQATPQG